MSFEEWFKAEYPNQHVFKESTPTCKSFYDGASVVWDYKQAEIDSLNKNIESLHIENERIQREYQMTFDNLRGRQQTIDALQRKLKLIEALRDNQFELLQVITQQRDSAQVGNIELQKRIDELEAKREGFMLVPLTKETVVTIERKVEQQLEASGITADPFRLDGWAILDAISAIEVQ